MGVMRCPSGHFYDDEKYDECPHCKNPLSQRPRAGIQEDLTQFGFTAPPLVQKIQVGGGESQDEKTVGIFQMPGGQDPVVGWLVCTQGRERGRDYRLHAGRNFIGRSLKSDVSIPEDGRISREDHCSLVYEPGQGRFVLVAGGGAGVQVNGAPLQEPQPLVGGEEIQLGEGTFVFVPFCGKGRTW